MLFEEILKDKTVIKDSKTKALTMALEIEREYNIKRITKAYGLKVITKAYGLKVKKISKSKLIKMAIDNLVNDIEELPEEEAIQYLRSLYKEAEF